MVRSSHSRGALAGAIGDFQPATAPLNAPIRGKRDRKRVEARPVALERDPKGVDPRPGWRVLSVCSIATKHPMTIPSDTRETAGRDNSPGQQEGRTRMRNRIYNSRQGGTHRRSVVPPPRGRRMVRLPEVMEITGLSRTTIWRRERDGSFPAPIRLGGEHTRTVGWREQDIYEWIDNLSPVA